MHAAHVTTRFESKAFWPARRAWAALAAVLAAGVGGAWWWYSSRSAPVRDARAATARARAYLRYGRPDLAFRTVASVRDEEPGAGEAVTVAAMALIQMGELRAARLGLERALGLQPDHFEAAMMLAGLNLDLGNGERGLELLRIASRLRPREFRIWLMMGNVLHDLGETPEAIHAYETALGLNPRHRDALIGLIGCLLNLHETDKVQPWVTSALQRFPDDPIVLGLAAQAAVDADRPDDAIALADRALARDPRIAGALLARARAHYAHAHWEQALSDAERAVTIEPNEVAALQLRFKIETRLGLTERASLTVAQRKQAQERLRMINQLVDEIASHPEDPERPWKMGQLALQSGKTLLASRCFEAALALDPCFQPARESLTVLRASHPELAQRPQP